VSVARVLAGLLVALLGSGSTALGQGEPPAELTEATIVEHDAAVEVWVRLSRPTKYQGELMDSPWRLVLDFEDTAYRWSVRPLPGGTDPLREVRGSQFRKGVARLVIELRSKVAYVIEQDREGLRIVLPRPVGVPTAPGSAPEPGPPPASAPRSTSKEPLVYGIVTLNEQKHAYIFDPTTGQVRRYAVGDAVGNAVVQTIGERTVVLKTPTGRVELRVDEARPGAAPARPAAPPPTRPR
jgi:AMIN domain-containing protein